MISSLLHLVGLRPRVYYTLTNFRGGGARPPWPPLNTPMGIHRNNYFTGGRGEQSISPKLTIQLCLAHFYILADMIAIARIILYTYEMS